MDLTPWRTYLAAAAIIVHQGLKFFGIDFPEAELSELVDAALATAAIVFRLLGHLKAKEAVTVASYTGPPR